MVRIIQKYKLELVWETGDNILCSDSCFRILFFQKVSSDGCLCLTSGLVVSTYIYKPNCRLELRILTTFGYLKANYAVPDKGSSSLHLSGLKMCLGMLKNVKPVCLWLFVPWKLLYSWTNPPVGVHKAQILCPVFLHYYLPGFFMDCTFRRLSF